MQNDIAGALAALNVDYKAIGMVADPTEIACVIVGELAHTLCPTNRGNDRDHILTEANAAIRATEPRELRVHFRGNQSRSGMRHHRPLFPAPLHFDRGKFDPEK